jgi:O-6-methylguanine DNA methyltransferase
VSPSQPIAQVFEKSWTYRIPLLSTPLSLKMRYSLDPKFRVGQVQINYQDEATDVSWHQPEFTWSPTRQDSPLELLARGFWEYFVDGIPLESKDLGRFVALYAESPFQFRVLQSVRRIPHGETRTYAWVAERAGNPRACRAVGQALRRNPLPLLIPCHRVVGANELGGFFGAGEFVSLKAALLQLESRFREPEFEFIRSRAT